MPQKQESMSSGTFRSPIYGSGMYRHGSSQTLILPQMLFMGPTFGQDNAYEAIKTMYKGTQQLQ
jgi:hypothetical protein